MLLTCFSTWDRSFFLHCLQAEKPTQEEIAPLRDGSVDPGLQPQAVRAPGTAQTLNLGLRTHGAGAGRFEGVTQAQLIATCSARSRHVMRST